MNSYTWPQYFLSSTLYCIDSARCLSLMLSSPARSAMVLATFSMRVNARALRP